MSRPPQPRPSAQPPVAGVVLAAGTSSRMEGRFKLLLPYGEGVVAEAPVRAALRAGLDPVVAVTGHRADEVRRVLVERFGSEGRGASRAGRPPPKSAGDGTARPPTPPGASDDEPRGGDLRIVFNPRFPEGQAKSLARGILEVHTATEAAAAAVLLGDEPGIRAEAVREVVEAWRRRASDGTPPVARVRYRDRPGHPVVFPRDVFGELEALEGDRGARAWLERNAARVAEVRVDADAPVDVDTEEDYRGVMARRDVE